MAKRWALHQGDVNPGVLALLQWLLLLGGGGGPAPGKVNAGEIGLMGPSGPVGSEGAPGLEGRPTGPPSKMDVPQKILDRIENLLASTQVKGRPRPRGGVLGPPGSEPKYVDKEGNDVASGNEEFVEETGELKHDKLEDWIVVKPPKIKAVVGSASASASASAAASSAASLLQMRRTSTTSSASALLEVGSRVSVADVEERLDQIEAMLRWSHSSEAALLSDKGRPPSGGAVARGEGELMVDPGVGQARRESSSSEKKIRPSSSEPTSSSDFFAESSAT